MVTTTEKSKPGDGSYDFILLGGGHNGLVFQAYLSRAGYRTLCLDRADRIGGACVTVERPEGSGFYHNTHSFFHRGIMGMPWFSELGLEEAGAEYLEPELNTAVVLREGRVLEWWTDLERTLASFGEFNADDAKRLQEWHERFQPVMENILIPESMKPPIPPEEREQQLSKTPEGRLLEEVSRLSPIEFVEQEFEDPAIKAGLLFFNGLREVDLRCRGFGHHIPALLASRGRPQMAVGGSARLTDALQAVVKKAGGDFLTGVEIETMETEGNRVTGVRLKDGRVFQAGKAVVSSLNPQQTFLDYLQPEVLPKTWRDRAAGFEYNLLAPLFGLYVNLKEPLVYKAQEKHPELEDALMIVLGLESHQQFYEIVENHEAGTIPGPVMWGGHPSHFDPSQAPEGKHTAFLWEKLPFALQGDPQNWDCYQKEHGQQRLDFWKEYAPNLEEATLDWFTKSALDTYRDYPNMRGGDLLVGSFQNGQMGYNRPFPGAGQYRTCLEGLYLCGSSSYPGGNVTGLPGYNAAQVVLGDLG